jgi:DNA/RNA endonuclease YhcR with UshA esterase domain
MNDAPLPGHAEQPSEIICSDCGRFVGALTRCPHCGARVPVRMSLRVFRYAALILATAGLGLLYLMATHRAIPLVRVADIKPTMNFAYVRVAGTVTGDARIFKEGERARSLRFMVDDGTGEIQVSAYQAQARKLVDADRVPRLGDRVEVSGSLGIGPNDDMILRLQVADQLALTRAAMPTTPLGDIDEGMIGTSLMIEGRITRVAAPAGQSRAPWTVTVDDGTGRQEITFWEDIYAEIRDKILLIAGTPVSARVDVRSYRGKLQLALSRGADLEFPGAGSTSNLTAGPGAPGGYAAREIALADVGPDLAGQEVKLTARVVDLRTPEAGSKAPYEIIFREGEKELTVVYWDNVAKYLTGNKPAIGALMSVRGRVALYKDKLQIKVNHSGQLSLVDVVPAPPAAAAAEPVKAGAVTKAMIGQSCVVRGKLGEPQSIRSGVIYPLTDESGSIQVVLWDRNVPGPDRDRLSTGVTVTVSGQVHEYQGTMELVPPNPQSLRVE